MPRRRLPRSADVILDVRKIEDYCLSPTHPRGRHKARVFRQALDLERGDAARLRDIVLEAARTEESATDHRQRLGSPVAPRCDSEATWEKRCGKNDLDRADRRRYSEIRNVLGATMKAQRNTKDTGPPTLDVVALLRDYPAHGLARGQVGTIVEKLDDKTSLVEFSDDDGHAYAIAPCPVSDLLVLHYVPAAA